MGSASQDTYTLPPATSPSLGLAHPTDAEKRRTWALNHTHWGGALTLEQYLKREAYFTTIPLTRDGGMTHWILTDSAWSPAAATDSSTRPVLASCESIRKRVLVAYSNPDPGADSTTAAAATVHERVGHGIGSVFTYPEFRGNRYAARMLSDLGPWLRKWQAQDGRDAACSALWSDIGKQYYAKKGWAAFPSLHAEFLVPVPVSVSVDGKESGREEQEEEEESERGKGEGEGEITPISYDNLEPLCQRDEQLLKERLLRTARATRRTSAAFAPDHDTLRWHLYRDDYISSVLFKTAAPFARGAIAGPEGRRVWAVWARSYGGIGAPADNVHKNKLYILRLVIEPEASEEMKEVPSNDIQEAFTAVMQAAQRESSRWHLGKVDLWNPSTIVKKLIDQSGLQHRWVERDEDSIPSMMWYGDEDVRNVEWVANEKYCWC
ncbi:uncharacterized protein F4812DRAFT_458372 [Daldinia caldariorum]|uniref:uncharacterized protein n=1 Tax=Daldinia caldariorum TaxID=326644 RepID=UPI0020081553|nr:uncharacterized protein F4812DRAFT_458372 [Daldinia caldariorum]KAI1468846.1 hypothetical protein F4812DRAFT_458372 [Daldinia caldariorum]